jgi:hypothetical protein
VGLANTNKILKPMGLSVRWRDKKQRKIGVIRHDPDYYGKGKERTMSIGVFNRADLFIGLSTPTWDRGSPTNGSTGWDLEGDQYDNGIDYTPPTFTAQQLLDLQVAIKADGI